MRHSWPCRTLSSSLIEMKKVDNEDRSSVRSALAKECGFTGLSILHRLNCLYGFNLLLDTVNDAMHNIPLNVISHLHYYLNGGKLAVSRLEKRFKEMPWTSGDYMCLFYYYNYETTVYLYFSL